MRRGVYPRFVQQRGWTQERADAGIAMMDAIAEKLAEIDKAEKAAIAPTLL